jgi:hypothetical protein
MGDVIPSAHDVIPSAHDVIPSVARNLALIRGGRTQNEIPRAVYPERAGRDSSLRSE